MQHLLRSIGSPDGRSPDLLDNYREPNRPGDVVWRVSPTRTDTPQLWPLFHPSEANPDGSLAVEVSPHGLTTVRIVTGHP